jgi:hypothetical protein
MQFKRFNAAALCACLAASVFALAGCNAEVSSGDGGNTGGNEPGVAGRNCTIEYRPLMSSDTVSVQKQRSGILQKVNANWVVLNEQNSEIWIPRDMVLEIRMEKK